jgi:hypothetical protein
MQIPRWGRVVAQPHEFLIHIRRGRVKTSGHGTSCFKWPGDSVVLLPTSIAKLAFTADQVTREKVGVEISGLAVYRIAEPLLAYRMIDGDVSRLGDIVREMFVGATRRIVAGLSLEECMTYRKERVARALLEEVAPVLAGQGEIGDTTTQGWGLVIDTIEIQNVRILSEEVFQRLQAPYREGLALAALRAREGVEEEQARIVLGRKRAEELARREMMAEEEARLAAERARETEAMHHQGELAGAKQESELVRADRQERANADRLRLRLDAELERRAREASAEIEIERARLEARLQQGEVEAKLARLSREARTELSDRQLEELMLAETLPRMADAFRGAFGEVSLVASSGSTGDLFGFLSAGLEHVVRATRRSARDTGSKDTS